MNDSAQGSWRNISLVSRVAPVARKLKSLPFVKLIALVVLFVWYPAYFTPWFSMIDADVWWHIRSGEWILQHHQLPHTDPFSITGMGKPWVAYSWPFGVLIYAVSHSWDLVGVVGFTILSWIAVTGVLFWLMRLISRNFWVATVLTLLGSLVFVRVVAPRPGNFTILFFLLTLLILLGYERSGRKWLLMLLPVILFLWANVHLQFIYGLFLIGVFALDPALTYLLRREGDYRRSMVLWVTLAVCTVVTVINPYGLGPWKLIWLFLHQPEQYRYVSELHAMLFNMKVHYVVLFLSILAAACLGRERKIRPCWLLLFIWSALQGFHMERDIWVLAVISLCIIANRFSEQSEIEEQTPSWVWIAGTGCVLVGLIVLFKIGPTNKDLLARVAREMPLGAVAYIHENRLQGPIFNNYDWGGFLIYALPEFPVAIDGRTNVHDMNELGRSLSTWDITGEWRQDPLLKNANLVIASPRFPLTHALQLTPDFKMVFNDGVAAVYQRVQPAPAP